VLEEGVARSLVSSGARGDPRDPSRKPAAQSARPRAGEGPPVTSSDQVLNALLTLLVRKGCITRQELETELSLEIGLAQR